MNVPTASLDRRAAERVFGPMQRKTVLTPSRGRSGCRGRCLAADQHCGSPSPRCSPNRSDDFDPDQDGELPVLDHPPRLTRVQTSPNQPRPLPRASAST